MIMSVTFNPALDVSGVVDAIVPDEKTYVDHEKLTPGGNGINAGIIASRLGASVALTGYLGGANGKTIIDLLKKQRLSPKFVAIAGPTRMNVTVSNRQTHHQTRLSFPGPVIRRAEKEQLLKKLSRCRPHDLVIMGGSLPQKFSLNDVKRLATILRRKNVPFVIDMPGAALSGLIGTRPLMIKPNLTEFQELTKTKATSIEEVITETRRNLSEIPLVCVSSVEGGALLITKDGAWFGKIPEVEIRSTVGAGDSMVGAMAYLIQKNPQAPAEELLRIGLAASCATLTEKGLTLGTKKDILKFAPSISLRKVSLG